MSDTDQAPSDSAEPAALPAIEFESPGRFRVHNPPALPVRPPTVSAASFRIDEAAPLQRFEQPEDARAHGLALLQQASRSLCLLSRDLDPWLYDSDAVLQACTRFLLASPRNRLRILVRDPGRLVRQGHRLLQLSHRLSSNCHIRKLNPDYPDEEHAILLADSRALLIRPRDSEPAGYVIYNDLGRGRQCQNQFDQAWQVSLNDPDLRSMRL